MKITLDIPDTTICAFFDFVRYSNNGMAMQGHSIGSDELHDGSEIKIEVVDKWKKSNYANDNWCGEDCPYEFVGEE